MALILGWPWRAAPSNLAWRNGENRNSEKKKLSCMAQPSIGGIEVAAANVKAAANENQWYQYHLISVPSIVSENRRRRRQL
jgi:hypothetical protein